LHARQRDRKRIGSIRRGSGSRGRRAPGHRQRIGNRIEGDIRDSTLPAETQAAASAGLVLAVTQGMSVLAGDGASLLTMVEAALRAWPGTEANDQAPAR